MLQRGAILSGTYRIDGVLGEGGMAVVYAATHLRNTARRAVKVLHQGSALKGNIRARFVREGKVANSVDHPGVVQMIDDGVTEDGSPYLVMELLNGVSVDELGSRAIPLNAALNIAYQVLDVLRAAHENGIIHRDIKPANLFVLRSGRVKVLDFGISRLHDGAEPFDSQATGSVMGTPFFMAPEQARADASEIDTRTDLFAVGATLFTLISGKYLHTGDDSQQVMIQAATRQARSLDSVMPGAPRAVVDLIAKAVAYDSDARWGSAQAMQEAVLQVHEALCGPLEIGTLATLVLTREFRRKSHARLTSPLSPAHCASNHVDSSPLSTTLPAVAGVTRSVESYRAAPNSADAPSSRISAEPFEFAGWTGQVPAPRAAHRGLSRFVSHFGGRRGKARLAAIGVLALASFVALFGAVRLQTQARVAAEKALNDPESRLPALPASASVKAEALLPPPPAAAAQTSTKSPRSARAPAFTKSQPTSSAVSAPQAPALEQTKPVERLSVAPTLIRKFAAAAPEGP